MAQIIQDNIVITLSRLVKEGEEGESVVSEEMKTTLASVAQEFAPAGVLVEIAEG